MPKQERIFTPSGNNKGLMCPFKPTLCQEEGSCKECQIYLDWQKGGEFVVICAWCGKVLDRKPGLGQTGVSHGICPKCKRKHFPELYESAQQQIEGGVGDGAKEATQKGG